MPNYLHGIETIEVLKGPVPVREVKSAVIFLVGTAPVQNTIPSGVSSADWYNQVVNQPILILNREDAVKYFGNLTVGYTIPYALDAIFDHGGATVIVVNVFNPVTHLVSGTPNPSAVTATDIIGTINSTTGVRTGFKLVDELYSRFGFTAKLLLCPLYCETAGVQAEMLQVATNIKAMALIDAQAGLTVQQVLTARGTGGSLNTSSYRAIICYPRVKVYDTQERLDPLSSRIAGLIARTDHEEGYWFSPSNKEILGIVGIERHLTASLNNPLSQTNILNENGVLTVFNSFGTGFRAWGNRSASFPSYTDPKNFISVRRTADIIAESIEFSTMQYLDKPIPVVIDAVLSTVNSFIRTLIGRGALIDGKCIFPKDKNPSTNLANGHLTFSYEIMPPTPAERMTFEQVINTDLLNKLVGA
ncbi:MAG: phage tail sheath subtilisin-like domain-containing protein [Candidatus Dojkabacteria bacterium]|nr:phage tail sheath subtilisin-like domain-containing protein [Candidatus Dojkabacteria bacterium]